ncbi:MAG: hypothetical protein MJZ75_00765 [Paludibacteraceae bacterium]|nr:hypothetical protein [Paludibacteraceae bacterium]
MKKGILILLLGWTAAMASARLTSIVELSVGGGWSSLGYKLDVADQSLLTAKQPGSYSATAHLGYGLMFNDHIGLGIGADFSHYGAESKLSGTAQWLEVADTEGEIYNHHTDINKWKDQQHIFMVEIPLTLYLQAPLSSGDVRFSGEIGAKVCLPVISNAKYAGELTHTAGYEPWQLVLQDVIGHGFYSSEMNGNYDLSTKMTVAAFAKIGLESPIDDKQKVWFFGHIYGTYHFMDALSLTDNPNTLGFHNDSEDATMRDAHYFMSDYNGITNTTLMSGKVKPFSIGIEIGLRFKFPHSTKFPCHCDRN